MPCVELYDISSRALLTSKPQHDSCAQAEIVLAIVRAVLQFGEEVICLDEPQCQKPRHFDIEASSSTYCKAIAGTQARGGVERASGVRPAY